jgi:hypothetical protein
LRMAHSPAQLTRPSTRSNAVLRNSITRAQSSTLERSACGIRSGAGVQGQSSRSARQRGGTGSSTTWMNLTEHFSSDRRVATASPQARSKSISRRPVAPWSLQC